MRVRLTIPRRTSAVEPTAGSRRGPRRSNAVNRLARFGFSLAAAGLAVATIGLPDASAQTSISITGSNDATALAATLFDAECTSISNAAIVGGAPSASDSQLGEFTASGIGVTDGVILSTGRAEALSGSTANTVRNFGGAAQGGSDPDVDALAANGAFDTASLTFDLTSPIATTITGEYILASDEWTEFSNGGYADALAIFVNGVNVALVPGTVSVVSIDTINNTFNPAFFVDNDIHNSTPPAPIGIEPDGLTVTLSFTANINAGLNTIKLGVVDDGDDEYDSWAFFQEGSFTCPPPAISVVKTADVGSVSAAGDPVQYSFTVTNDGVVTVNSLTVTDPLVGSVSCPVTTLGPGLSTTCTADSAYIVTQADMDAGQIDNTATATASDINSNITSNTDSLTVLATQSPSIAVAKSADVGSVSAAGDSIQYSFDVTNDGNVTLDPVSVSDPLAGAVTCPVTVLAPGVSTTCTADSVYTASQADMDAGQVDNTATASGTPPSGPAVTDVDSVSVPATQSPSIAVVKSADVGSVSAAGDSIQYSFDVTNDGNVTLDPVSVSDPLAGAVTCPVTLLAPGVSTTCTADSVYTASQADMDAGQVDNTATASGTPPSGPAVTDSDSVSVPATQSPSIAVVKSADVGSVSAAGDSIQYSFDVTNDGNVTLDPVSVSDPLAGAVTCPVTVLAPGVSTTCTADSTYLVSQADIDAGQVDNTVTASGTPPSGPAVTDSDSVSVPATQSPSIAVVKSADVGSVSAAGDSIQYSFDVTNDGNVTLDPISVSDPLAGAVTCPVTVLAPGVSTTCTADSVYTASQADMDAGQVDNTATASGTPPSGPAVTDVDSVSVPATQSPSIAVVKSADVGSVSAAGDSIQYSFDVTNDGNVTLDPVSVSDPLAGAVTCPVTVLAPGVSTTCTADSTYSVSQADIDAGQVDNTATASGTPPSGPAVTDSDSVSVLATQSPSIAVVKSADVGSVSAAGDSIQYSFDVTNDGNVTLDPVSVSDPLAGAVTCPVTVLAPGVSTTCTADSVYTASQADMDAGQVDNTATASGTPPSGPVVTDSDSVSVPATQSPSIDLVKSSTTTALTSAGQVVPFEFLVTNDGNVTLDPISVDDPQAGPVTCPVTSLAPGVSTTCTASYTVTQADVDAGSFVNTATATGTPPTGPDVTATDSVTTPANQNPSIALVKTADVATVSAAGDAIQYSFDVTNDGNVTLDPVSVSDPLAGAVTCPVTVLAPGVSTTCTADALYAVTQADVDAGQVDNTATASGTPPSGPAVTDVDSVSVPATQSPSISLVKNADVGSVSAAGDSIQYSFDVTNDGNVTLDPISVSDPLAGAVTCPVTSLAPGVSTTCTADALYAVTQAEIDAGQVDNTATASGTPPSGPVVTDVDSVSVPATQLPSIDLVKSSSTAALTSAGQVVPFEFLVTNDGNVTLDPISVDDPQAGPVTCPVTSLAPGVSTTCTASYIVTQADVDAGSFVNTATATGTPPIGPDVTATDSVTTPANQNPSIALVKTADVASVSAAGDSIQYTFDVTNDGNVTLDPVSVSDPLAGAVTCPVTVLAPGASTICAADALYAVTQADVDAGQVDNTATASGTPPSGPAVTDVDSVSVPATQSPSIALVKTADVASVSAAGDSIQYSFDVTNDGNVTLDPISVSDPLAGAVTCPVTVLAPGVSTTCTADAVYSVTQAEIDAGQVDNTATASGTPPSGPAVTDSDSVSVPATQSPSTALVKNADVASVSAAGDPIQYSFDVTNDGNVTLDPVAVSDPLAGSITCPVTVLAPGASTTCTADALYNVSQADIDAGQVDNTATASGAPPSGPVVTDVDSVSVPATQVPSIDLVKSSSTTALTAAGQVVPFEFLVTNDGNVTLDPISVDDPQAGPVTCPVTVLAPGASTTCTASYVVTQADVDVGSFVNTATATGTPPTGPDVTATDSVTTPANQNPSIALVKNADVASVSAAGDPIQYSFDVTNDGNVTLDPVSVSDPLAGAVTCPVTVLAPGVSTTCTADAVYSVSQAEIDAGQVDNTATASGTPPSGPAVTDDDSVSVPATQSPSIALVKNADVASVSAAGDSIQYSFDVTNDGNVTLDPVSVSDPLAGAVTCPVTSLAPGVSTTCVADALYSVTQAEIDAGQVDNTATASGTPPSGPAVTDVDSVSVPATQTPSIALVKNADVASVSAAGDSIQYSFDVTNDGNVTLDPVSVSDPLAGSVTCPVTSLAPGVSTTCTADSAYTVTQADVDAGQVDNTATASGTPPSGPVLTDVDSVSVPATQSPSIAVVKAADVASVSAAGDSVQYSFDVTNDGNVTLDPVSVSDPLAGAVTCPVTSLAPGASTTCVADAAYVVLQADIDAGQVDNTATASGTPPSGPVVTDVDSVSVPAATGPEITVVKSADVASVSAAGDSVQYSFVVSNSGNVTLDPVSVSDPLAGSVTCPVTVLAPGLSTTCTADSVYSVSQAEIDAGQVDNTATASGTPPSGPAVTDDDSVSVPATQSPSIAVAKSADVVSVSAAGDSIQYTFDVTNDGNVTLDPVSVSDPLAGAVTCPVTSLAPGVSTTCTADAVYSVSQADIDAGQVDNTATASGTPPSGPAVTDSDSVSVPATQSPSIDLVKSSSTTALTSAGQVVPFEFLVTNDGNVTVDPVSVSDPQAGPVTCPVTSLAPGVSTTCTASYTVTQADVDAGSFVNTATAAGTPPTGPDVTATDSVTTPANQNPSIALVKTADVASVSAAGDSIQYIFDVTNDGNVTLDPVSVSDPLAGAVTCPVTVLAPGASTTCTADAVYSVSQAEIDAGQVDNTASASGTPPSGPAVTDVDGVSVPATQSPSIAVVKSADVASVSAAGDAIQYSLDVTNNGNVTLDPVSVSDPLAGSVTCPVTSLAPGASTTCIADALYSVTQADIDAGQVDNTATASGTPPSGPAVTDVDSVSVPAAQSPSIALVKSADVATVNAAGDSIQYSFDVTNDGNVTLDPVSVSDPLAGAVTCPVTSLAPGVSTTCVADALYSVTQAEIDAGQVDNTATATGTSPSGPAVIDSDSVSVPATQSPSIAVVKSADVGSVSAAGDSIQYSFGVTNDGNVTLDPVSVSDPLAGAVTCPVTSLAPGSSTTCSADAVYSVTQSDIDGGQVDNTATASGTPPSGPLVTDVDSVSVPATQLPSIAVVKSADVASVSAAGDSIQYSFDVTNDGNVTLNPVSVSDPLAGSVTCPVTSLSPGGSITCTADSVYTVSQADIDAGQIDNTATASGTPTSGPVVTDVDSISVPATQSPSIAAVKSADVASVSAAGDSIQYSFDVTNDGNVTLDPVSVSDPLAGAVTCPVTSLAPGVSITCTADSVYAVSQADIDAGQIDNTATASGTPPSGPAVTDVDSVSVPATQSASIDLVKSSSTTALTSAGQVVPFEFLVTNDGNVTLDPVSVSDPQAGPVTCPVTALAPGVSTTCTASYTVTQADVDAGSFVNIATATGTPPTGPDVTATDSVTTPANQNPSIALVKNADVASVSAAGDPIQYSFDVTNDGNVTLDPVSVSDPLAGAVTCPVTVLAPGVSTTCTADALYSVSQADIDAGQVDNTATASGTPPAGPVVTDGDSVSVAATQSPSIALTKNADVASVSAAGDLIQYSFDVTNDGNVTLDPVSVSDPLAGAVTCPVTSLAPGASTTCTADASYSVSQAEVDAGQVDNTATANGTPPSGPVVTDSDSVSVPAAQSASIDLVKSSSTTALTAAGQVVPFEFLVTNDGNVTLDPISVDDPQAGPVTCPVTSLAPGVSTTCTASYTVTQADVDAGSFVNTATATGTPPTGPDVTATDSVTTPANQNPSIALVKTADVATVSAAGDAIQYTFDVTNDGNVTLDPISVSDPLAGAVTCPVTVLAPGVSTTCTADNVYNASQAEIDAGQVDNTATASGTPPSGPAVTDDDTVSVPATQSPSISLVKNADAASVSAAGDSIQYSFDVTNDGNITLDPVSVSDPLAGSVTCPASSLAPGVSTTCTADSAYTVTQADVDAGQIDNTATASGTPPSGPAVTDSDSVSVPANQSASIDLVKSSSTAALTAAGQVVPFEFLVTNDGNVTLDPVSVSDPQAGPVTCPVTSLAPGVSTTCTADYTVTQADVDAGSFVNTATATGTPPTGPDVTATDSVTTPANQNPSIALVKTADVASVSAAGDSIQYSFDVTNDGNVTLDPVSVSDPLAGAVTCPVTVLAPGVSTTCTADALYSVSQAEIDAGQVDNTATASGTPPSGPAVTDSGSVSVPATQSPSIALVKAADVASVSAAGDSIQYSFDVTNDGNVTLDPVSVSDPLVGAVTCPVTSLAPGVSTTCTADSVYTVSQADVDAGQVDNTATTSGTPPSGPAVTDSDSVSVPAAQSPSIALAKSADVASVSAAGESVQYSFDVSNDGNATLDPVSVSDPLVGAVTCPVTSLAPGASTTCTADNAYIVTQADVDAGQVDNTATASGTPPSGPVVTDVDSVSVPANQNPSIALVKNADVASVSAAGDAIQYSFDVTNDGNVTLDPLSVSDPLVGAVTCPVTVLAPGASTTCVADAAYVVSQADIDAGQVDNTATASGAPPSGPAVTEVDSVSVPVTQLPSITLVKNADVASVSAAGDSIQYTVDVTNDGNVTLDPISVSDPLAGAVTCPVTALAPGASTTCTADNVYNVSQADVDSGQVDNTATASGTPLSGPVVTDVDSITTPANQIPSITLTKNADVASVSAAGDSIQYSFDVTNDGNVTLDPVSVSDPLVGAVTCPVTSLSPGGSITCTADAVYSVTQADIDAGQVDNTANASGTPPSGPAVTDSDSVSVPAAQSASIDLVKSSSTTALTSAGQVVPFEFLVTNDGNVTLDPISVDDPQAGPVTCPVTSLAPGVSTTCTASYVVTQADVDAGSFVNIATATGTPPTGPDVTATDSVTTPANQNPSIAIVKTADVASVSAAGDVIQYTFDVTNDGNVTLDPVSVSDPLAGSVTCPVTGLAPGVSTACTADAAYSVSQADIDAGQIDNTATASGTPPSGPVVTDVDSVSVPATQSPSIALVKNADVASVSAAGDPIQYSFDVTNDGNVTLDPVSVSDPLAGAVTCPVTVLAPGASTTCTADAVYSVTQADIDAGQIDNTASASGTPPSGPVVTDVDSVSVPATQSASIDLVKSSSTTALTAAGQVVPFEFLVTNDGNVTLDPISVDDPQAGPVTCPVTSLAPAVSTTCTASYVVTQADVDAGSFVNTATATGTPPTGADVTATDSVTTPANQNSSIALVKNADVATVNAAGDPVQYSFDVTNDGNVTLDPISVSDPLVGSVSCPVLLLGPGDSTTCTADNVYNATQIDIDAGQIDNTATASGTPPSGPDATDQDSLTIPVPNGPAIALVKSTTTAELTSAGQIVPFEFEVTNTGNVTLNPISVDDPLTGPVACPVTTLAPGVSTTCTANYTVTQADVDAGSFINTATATGTPPSGPAVTATDSVTTPAAQTPSIDIDKLGPSGLLEEGETLTYTLVVTNDGNVTLDPVAVDDPTANPVTCPTSTLAPTESVLCSATYLVTQADVDAGQIVNTATATGTPPTGPTVNDSDTETTTLPQSPDITLAKSSAATTYASVGETVAYTFDVTNNGNVTLDPVSVDDPLTGPVSCPVTVLAPGASTTCTADYLVTQADLDSGQIVNVATASGTPPSGPAITDDDTVTIPATQSPDISLLKSSSTTELTFAGQVGPVRVRGDELGQCHARPGIGE